MTLQERTCPGCGLRMPVSDKAVYDGYFNTSPECWSLFTEVVGKEFGNAVLFGQAHQLTVDAYAVQHAGGPHPDKSVAVHLSGLHLILVRGWKPPDVARRLQQLADKVEVWPHFPPPEERGTLTVWDVAFADSEMEHVGTVKEWAGQVWGTWSACHGEVADFVGHHLALE